MPLAWDCTSVSLAGRLPNCCHCIDIHAGCMLYQHCRPRLLVCPIWCTCQSHVTLHVIDPDGAAAHTLLCPDQYHRLSVTHRPALSSQHHC